MTFVPPNPPSNPPTVDKIIEFITKQTGTTVDKVVTVFDAHNLLKTAPANSTDADVVAARKILEDNKDIAGWCVKVDEYVAKGEALVDTAAEKAVALVESIQKKTGVDLSNTLSPDVVRNVTRDTVAAGKKLLQDWLKSGGNTPPKP